MSPGIRTFLGIWLFVSAAGAFALVSSMGAVSPRAGPGMAYLGLYCLAGAVTCFGQSYHPLTIRILGTIVFLACVWHVVDRLSTFAAEPNATETAVFGRYGTIRIQRNREGLIESLLFMGFVGASSVYAALEGCLPGWKRRFEPTAEDER